MREAVAQAVAAGGGAPIDATSWPMLIEAAQGSVRRLLALSRSEGLGVHARLKGLVSSLPRLDWTEVHSLADAVTGHGAEQRFEQLMDLLSDTISRLVRVRAVGAGEAEIRTLAQRLIPDHGLASWAELWETVQTKRAETAALNLDRKTLILETLARMQAASRG